MLRKTQPHQEFNSVVKCVALTGARQRSKVRERSGFTLIEILLVLAIIIIAAAAVSPALRGVMRNARLRAAASDVRAALTKAHVTAMKTGRIHVFQYELGTRRYKLEPWISDDDALESKDASGSAPPPPSVPAANEKSLPEETKFAAGDATVECRGETIEQELQGTSGGAAWSRPILFYPDGSTADAFIVVGNEHNVGIRIDLRGHTAAVHVGEMGDLKLLESGTVNSK